MKRATKFKIFGQLRTVFNIMMAIGYLLLSYLILLISFRGGNFQDSKLAIIVIALCSMGQISQYYDAYKGIRKTISYYVGTIPPALALLCLIFAVTKAYLFG